jgi:hypothetical protein
LATASILNYQQQIVVFPCLQSLLSSFQQGFRAEVSLRSQAGAAAFAAPAGKARPEAGQAAAALAPVQASLVPKNDNFINF